MPRIIRNALFKKLCELPEMQQFQSDFEALSGLKLAFVDELGLGDEFPCHAGSPCAGLHGTDAGRALCARTRHALLAHAADQPAMVTCDAGLNEAAVPVNISGIRAGFLVFGGTTAKIPDDPAIRRVQHLLKKSGVTVEPDRLREWLTAAPLVPKSVFEAYLRVANLAAKQIALAVTDQLADPVSEMPPAVAKACGFIRKSALVDDINLAIVARHCGVSDGHFSRLFHRTTGLTFREYLTQVRIEHAKVLILGTAKTVTEIAFESGFQSLSQFHRAFRKAHGISPGKMRSQRRAALGSAARTA